MLKNVVYNEMSTSRNTNNMAIFQVIFKAEPEHSALLLADIFQVKITKIIRNLTYRFFLLMF